MSESPTKDKCGACKGLRRQLKRASAERDATLLQLARLQERLIELETVVVALNRMD